MGVSSLLYHVSCRGLNAVLPAEHLILLHQYATVFQPLDPLLGIQLCLKLMQLPTVSLHFSVICLSRFIQSVFMSVSLAVSLTYRQHFVFLLFVFFCFVFLTCHQVLLFKLQHLDYRHQSGSSSRCTEPCSCSLSVSSPLFPFQVLSPLFLYLSILIFKCSFFDSTFSPSCLINYTRTATLRKTTYLDFCLHGCWCPVFMAGDQGSQKRASDHPKHI